MITPRQTSLALFVFLFWGLFFFRSWAGLWRIKVIELTAMIGQPRDIQLQVLHPTGEMKHLLELRQMLSSPDLQGATVVAPTRDQALPQAHNASILRAVLYPIPVEADADRLEHSNLLVVIVASSSASVPKLVTCSAESDTCPCYSQKREQQEVLCWHMPTP